MDEYSLVRPGVRRTLISRLQFTSGFPHVTNGILVYNVMYVNGSCLQLRGFPANLEVISTHNSRRCLDKVPCFAQLIATRIDWASIPSSYT